MKLRNYPSVKITKIECSKHLNFCKSSKCYLTPVNRTRTLLTLRCDLRAPVDLITNVAIEIRNSKNIYITWFNQTFDYCATVGKNSDGLDIRAWLARVFNEVDPDILQSCPVKGSWGTTNYTVDSNLLEKFPMGVLPTTVARISYTAWTTQMEHIMDARLTWDIRRIGVDFKCGSYTCY